MTSIFFYFAVFAITFFLNFRVAKAKSKKTRALLIILSFSILLVLVAIRYRVGTDYDAYLENFKEIKHLPWSKIPTLRMEILPAALMKLTSYFSESGVGIFAVLGALTLWPIYKINKLYDYKYLPFSVLTYCVMLLPFSMNGMRQGVAMSFALLAFVYLAKGKSIKSGINFTIAFLSHTSALLMLPHLLLYFICEKKKWKFTKLSFLVSTVIGIVVLFFLNNFLVSHDITAYNYILKNVDLGRINFIGIIFYLPILLMIMLISKTKGGDKEADKISEDTKSLVFSGAIFDVIGTSATFLSRFALYFTAYEVLIIPALIQKIRDKKTRFYIECLVIIFFIAYFVVQYYVIGRHEIIPYRTWISGGVV